MNSDFLVIGCGIAGLSFALKAAKHGTVAIITKGKAMESNTAWAQGGIAGVLPEGLRAQGDNIESHVADTLDAGAGLCDEEAVRIILSEGAQTLQELIDSGVDFDKDSSADQQSHDSNTPAPFSLGKEGGHSHRRILHAKDTTGKEIAESLLQKAQQHPSITLLEDHFAIDLITTGKLGMAAQDRVLGAYVLDEQKAQVHTFRSDRVILATGGCGKVYLYTTNPDSSTGDGVAMAWRARATVSNMEFVQFHPTCFFNPAATGAEARSFLVSEAVRGEGGILRDQAGREFMDKYDDRKSLAPRDIVARAIDHEIKKTGAQCVYLDVTHKPKGFMKERFPYIYQTLLAYGHDCEKHPIPVVPAAHYQCGGVVTDTHGQTDIRGLYAIGEVACTGLHGANRLASNSLLEGHVIARRAYENIIQAHPLNREAPTAPEIPAWEYGDTAPPDEQVVIYHNWDEIRRLMWDYVSIVRTTNRLDRAASRLSNLQREVRSFYWGHRVTSDILELRNLVTTASIIVDCAKRRKESRGIHYTLDYPQKDELHATPSELRKF